MEEKQKTIDEMTIEEVRGLPVYDVPWNHAINCDSVAILPSEDIHDSGWRTMWFVPCVRKVPLGLVKTPTDDLEIGGPVRMDCCPTSRLVHIWRGLRGKSLTITERLSTTTIQVNNE